MTLPTQDTRVTYPAGEVLATTTVLHTVPTNGGTAVILESTCCHPVDVFWPDQPADRAVLRTPRGSVPIIRCLIAATDGTALYLGTDAPVRPGTDGWTFLVAHLVADADAPAEGERVEVAVDDDMRESLSRGHTACHLASLALNRALADRWGKQTAADALGTPDFDHLAIESSRIQADGSCDRFRLNKSLRRKGFRADGLADELMTIQLSVDATLEGWVASGSAVTIERDGDRLTDRRRWSCTLEGKPVSIPCGGTHAHSLAELGHIYIALGLDDDHGTPVLEMRTSVSRP